MSYGAAAAAVLGALIWLVGTEELLVVSVLGLGTGAVLLCVSAWVLVKLVGPLRHGAGVAWRYGLANIARRKGDSVAQVMAFGFGLSVLMLLSGVRTDLLDTWYASLPEDAPNHFMINIQREEADGIRQVFTDFGREAPRLMPMVRGRLTEINGEDLEARIFRGEGGWLRREANLTWAEELDPSNEVIEGAWWGPDAQGAEISIEQEIAQGMALALGDDDFRRRRHAADGRGHEHQARRVGLVVAELLPRAESGGASNVSRDFHRVRLHAGPASDARDLAPLSERYGH